VGSPYRLPVAILAEGSASIRLRSTDSDAFDKAVWEWYTYCEQYVLDASLLSGYNESPLVHSYEWLKIDDTRLDVFFVGIHPSIVNGNGTVCPVCLNSTETMKNTSWSGDMCSRLTLGHFSENLMSGRIGRN